MIEICGDVNVSILVAAKTFRGFGSFAGLGALTLGGFGSLGTFVLRGFTSSCLNFTIDSLSGTLFDLIPVKILRFFTS